MKKQKKKLIKQTVLETILAIKNLKDESLTKLMLKNKLNLVEKTVLKLKNNI